MCGHLQSVSQIEVKLCRSQAYTSGLVSHNTKLYWKRFFEEELGPLPELVYTQVRRTCG